MTNPLGHDIDGRPLWAGDEVAVLHSTKGNEGKLVKVMGLCDDGDLQISIKAPCGRWRETRGEYLRKLHNDHRPADESFGEMMKAFKGERVG